MLPVFETPRYRREADRRTLSEFAETIRQRLLADDDPSICFDRALPDRTWITTRKRHGHIVGRIQTVQLPKPAGISVDVLCLLRVIGFDEPDCDYILGAQAKSRVRDLPHALEFEELQAFAGDWLQRAAQLKLSARESLAPLPPEYVPWLSPPQWVSASDLDPFGLIVYETRSWRLHLRTIEDHWSQVHVLLSDFLYSSPPADRGLSGSTAPESAWLLETDRRVQILCLYWQVLDEPGRRVLLLVDARNLSEPGAVGDDAWVLSCLAALRGDASVSASLESGQLPELMRSAIRSYPGFFLDKDAYNDWKKIENEEAANLAMSPEESALLTRLTHASGTDGAMPAFINGRAGSGKSTVLFYLFAHYWMYGRRPGQELPGQLLFLTLNNRLLEESRRTVEAIIDADCRSLRDHDTLLPANHVKIGFSDAFQPFRSLLLQVLPAAKRAQFARDKEIDYEAFRRLLLNRDSNRDGFGFRGRLPKSCSPELAWHVIRSYIKGFSADGLLDAGQYRLLPRMDRSVGDSHFQDVYDKLWPWYRSLTEDRGFWDQQDLARDVHTGLTEERWSLPPSLQNCVVIFCDEAQDLTGVELAVVLRLSFLARHDLRVGPERPNIPFAFAGDPLQTLNPTGFRWENLTSSFYRNLLEPLGQHRSLEKTELHFNYRSPQRITRLANLVQFHRRAVFRDNYLRPQRPWSLGEGMPPSRSVIPEDLTSDRHAALQNSFVLLPCADGHEQEFVERYPFLKRLQELPEPPEVLSVAAAKGLDLKKVIVFGFGCELFKEGIPLPVDDEVDESGNVGLSYAFNQLYVAVTRSTDELLIMDTEEGHRQLWDQLLDASRMGALLREMDSATADAWRAVLPAPDSLQLSAGLPAFARLDVAGLIEQATSLRESGRALRRPEFMLKAAAFFRRAGQFPEESHCLAEADWYSGHYEDAARELRRLDLLRDAAECLWEGRQWVGLATLQSHVRPAWLAIAKFMVSGAEPTDRIATFLDDIGELSENLQPPSSPQWRDFVAKLVPLTAELIQGENAGSVAPGLAVRVAHLLRVLGYLGHTGCRELAADAFARGHEWDRAREQLDLVSARANVRTRFEILAHTSAWPDYIIPCDRNELYGLLVQRWRKEGERVTGMSPVEGSIVFEALWRQGARTEAKRIAFAADLLDVLSSKTKDLSAAERVRLLRLAALKSREVFEKVLPGIWKQRSGLELAEWRDFLEALCSAGEWERVAEVAHGCLGGTVRPVELSVLCDVIAGQTGGGRVDDPAYIARERIGDAILAIAKRLGTDWPTSDVDLLRVAAGLETLGFDKHLSSLGRTYGDAKLAPVRDLARQIYLRGRLLYAQRLEHSKRASAYERVEAERETMDQWVRWGLRGEFPRPNRFLAPTAVRLDDGSSPFSRCSSPVSESSLKWFTEVAPHCIQVSKREDGKVNGTVEIELREGRRSKVTFIDIASNELELATGRKVTLEPGLAVEDPDTRARCEITRLERTTLVSIQIASWPEGIVISLPTNA